MPGHAVPVCAAVKFASAGAPLGEGLPALIPYAPNLANAATCCARSPVGKQPARVARPAGVGVVVPVEYVVEPENRSLSTPPKMNHLFFSMGPPMVPPLNSSLLRRGPVCGLHCGLNAFVQVTVPGKRELVPGLLA